MKVPWDGSSGDEIESFVAAMLLLRFPNGTRITPSQGDQGVDVKVPTPGGFDVYQIKKYSQALKADQAAKVRDSWEHVNTQFGAENTITAWYLAMPWNPTREREQWFKNLTKDADFPCRWLGREHLDGWAADNPALVDYFFGNGQSRIENLIASLSLGPEIELGESDEARLNAVIDRYRRLQGTLDTLSPFYRYRLTVIPEDQVRQRQQAVIPSSGDDSLVVTYRRIGEGQYVEIAVATISDEAAQFDPISIKLQFTSDQDSADDLDRFYRYGIAPPDPVAATIVDARGPVGAVPELGEGTVVLSDIIAPNTWETLALHVVSSDATVEPAVIEIGQLVTTRGVGGGSIRSTAHALGVELTTDRDSGAMTLSTWQEPIGGRLPHHVLPELAFAQRIWSGSDSMVIAVPNGPTLVKPARLPERLDDAAAAERWANIATALVVLQKYTLQQLRMPTELSGKEADSITLAAELVLKKSRERSWDRLKIVSPAVPLDGVAAIVAFWPLRLVYDEQAFEFDVTVRQECDAVEVLEVSDDHLWVRPVDGAPVRETLVQRGDYDYRVLSRRVMDSHNQGWAATTPPSQPDLSALKVAELREMAKSRQRQGYSRLRKSELIMLLSPEAS